MSDPLDHFTDLELTQIAYKLRGKHVKMGFREFVQLFVDAGIKAEDVGNKGYHLSRINDEGPYTYENCRYIPWHENLAERKTSMAMKRASSKNSKIGHRAAQQKYEEGQQFVRDYLANNEILYHPRAKPSIKITQEEFDERLRVITDCWNFNQWGYAQRAEQILGTTASTLIEWTHANTNLYNTQIQRKG